MYVLAYTDGEKQSMTFDSSAFLRFDGIRNPSTVPGSTHVEI
jgi:hypothetical protein